MKHGVYAAALVVALLVAAGASRAVAQNVDPATSEAAAVLAQIGEAELYARYDEAIRTARALLARSDLTAAQRNAGLEKLAIAQVANGDDRAATDTLRTLYGRDPQHRLDDADASPRVQSAFSRARESHPTRVPVQLEHTPQSPAAHEAPLVSVVVTQGADAVEEVRLSYRSPGDTRYVRVGMAYDHGVARARIPVGEGMTPQPFDYFLEALAPSGAQLAHAGTDAQPLAITVPPTMLATAAPTNVDPEAGATTHVAGPPDDGSGRGYEVPHIGDTTVREGDGGPSAHHGGSVTDEWWFWTLIAAVVIGGGATALYFAVGPPSQPEPSGTLGVITLR